jgi:DNA-binding transcriptional ArsR family regulator
MVGAGHGMATGERRGRREPDSTRSRSWIRTSTLGCPSGRRTFSALADPARREILVRLTRGPASISELAEPFGITLTGLKKHVQVLEDARLVITEKVGWR